MTVLLKIRSAEEGNTNGYVDLTGYIRGYQVEYSDMDASTERCAAGNYVRDHIRTVRTVRCTFRICTGEEMARLVRLFRNKSLEAVFFDIENGELTGDVLMYPSLTRNLALYSVADDENMYQEFSMELTEF